jgi:hypothetical protein
MTCEELTVPTSIAFKFAKQIGFMRISGNLSSKTIPSDVTPSDPKVACAACLIHGPHSEETVTPVTASANAL